MNLLYPESKRRDNCFNLVRLLLAIMVVLNHSFLVTRGWLDGEPFAVLTRRQAGGGTIAVDAFFVISGLLITGSWMTSRNAGDYLRKRALRIYPGYMVAVLVSLLIAGLCSPPSWEYWRTLHKADSVEALFTLSAGFHKTEATFRGNPYVEVNASLWTIQREAFCYVVVAALGIAGLLHRRSLMTLAFVALFVVYAGLLYRGQLPALSPIRCMTCFGSGALFYLWRDRVPAHPALFWAALVALAVGAVCPPWFRIVFPLTGAYALLYAACNSRGIANRLGSRNDLSYGTYLYAFPIQQALVYTLGIRNAYLLFALTLPTTLGFAALSWFLVEKRFLRAKREPTQSGLSAETGDRPTLGNDTRTAT